MTRLTALTKLKLSTLHEAAKKVGGQSALARLLGVSPSEFGEWVNLKRCPPREPSRHRDQAWVDALDLAFMQHVGCGIDEIWSEELRTVVESKRLPSTFEKTAVIQDHALLTYAAETTARLTYAYPTVEQQETSEAVLREVNKLPPSYSEALKMRHGLDGYAPHTLDEIGGALGITRERVRQIIVRGERMLSVGNHGNELVKYL